ncbi:MAG: hypothetical protein U1D55_19160 [Phycisphaerae bacterium]
MNTTMSANVLRSRRAQMTLLVDACRQREPARLASPAADAGEVPTRFLAIEPDGVLLDASQEPRCSFAPHTSIQVRFSHDGVEYRFSAAARGERLYNTGGAAIAALKIDLPMRITCAPEPHDQALDLLNGLDAIPATISGILKPELCFEVRLQQLSRCDARTLIAGSTPRSLRKGDVCWLEFELPGEPRRCELVVRLMGVDSPTPDASAMEWSVHPVEDPEKLDSLYERLERFAAAQRGISCASAEPASRH